jgi:hypothetical protein
MNTDSMAASTKTVRFDVDVPPETKHSRPPRKKSKIPNFSSPRAYVIVLPWDEMLARVKKANPDAEQFSAQEEVFAVNLLAAELCDQASEIWPNTFCVLVDHKSFHSSLQCIGLADNTHRKNRILPTPEQVQQIRACLDLNGEEFRVGWYRDLFPDDHLEYVLSLDLHSQLMFFST